MQPGLCPALVAATFVPRWHTVSDPWRLTEALANAFEQRGGRLGRAEAQRLEPGTDAVRVHRRDGMAFLAEFGAERDIAEQAKTRWALEYYANKLRKGRTGRGAAATTAPKAAKAKGSRAKKTRKAAKKGKVGKRK